MRQATCRSVLLLVWFVLTIPSFAEPQLWGRLHAGPYAVGFRVDKPSTLKEELHIWYPAEQSRSAPMTFGDYLRLSHDLLGAAAGFEHSTVALRTTLNRAVTGKDDVLGQEKADEILGLVMKAVRNAHPERGQFPLVFWTHRYAITSAQSVLNEYLASHGFVVIFAPESAPPPMPSDLKSDAEKSAEFIRLTVRLQKALSFAKRLPNVQSEKVAVIGWSYAGEAAFALQQADRDVRVVIGLTTNVLDRWVYRPDELKSVTPAQLTAPYVLIDGGTNTRPALMADAASRTFFVHMKDMAHGSFNVLEGMLPSVEALSTVPPWSRAGPHQQLGFEVAMQYVRRSCEQYLKAMPTLDTPFTLWDPDGELPDGFVTMEQGGKTPPLPPQPNFSTVEFPSVDKLAVTADWYSFDNKRAPTIILVHQSGSSRGEYRQIAPRLQQMGFNALAIDSRWGERDRWNGVTNETAVRAGTSAVVASGDIPRMRAMQAEAAQDVGGALRWLDANGYTGPKLLWGSSISANLVLKLAATPDVKVVAVLAFSPGEYHKDQPTEMRSAVANLTMPTLIVYAEDEEQTSKPIFDAIPTRDKVFYRATTGKHAASILVDDPGNWNPIEPFLKRFL